MSDSHATRYYAGSGSETTENSGPIESYDCAAESPEALSEAPIGFSTPQPGLNAPIAQDKRRGSS